MTARRDIGANGELITREAIAYLRVSPSTFWRNCAPHLHPIEHGPRCFRWLLSELDALKQARRRGSVVNLEEYKRQKAKRTPEEAALMARFRIVG